MPTTADEKTPMVDSVPKKRSSRFSLKSSDSTSKAMSTSTKKSKSFRGLRKGASSLRGVITGESRAQRIARRQAKKAKRLYNDERKPRTEPIERKNTEEDEEDLESVYGVDIEKSLPETLLEETVTGEDESNQDKELSLLSPIDAKLPAESSLQIVLLLMDPTTRRFELLQLEFDSNESLVSHVLEQVPLSVTEETLKTQKYTGVCDRFGMEMIDTMKLSKFCGNHDVILAIPEGTSSKDTSHLAKNILKDEKVVNMLTSNGILYNLSLEPPTPKALFEEVEAVEEKKSCGSVILKIMSYLIFLGIAVGLQLAHGVVTEVISPDTILPSGSWRIKCGVFSVLPSSITECQPAGIHMTNEGVLKMYGPDGKVVWTMEGDVCGEDQTSCVDGLIMDAKGAIKIGSKTITSYTVMNSDSLQDLSPWPFTVSPKVRMVKERNSK
eukprot:CAMPEP_0195280904 /NCGR_PEP_ID=MMETSP0707-20130614/425_1 /TAXON_ID=33640 /ORGANISM="Asterionellopsis glacialis, Strain CCMP134" /LENGTH=439 /DNA_ID=CAMNT_0040339733 /DNA_START=112 /DNA_END=1431 /DNA_ORIENTATION=-